MAQDKQASPAAAADQAADGATIRQPLRKPVLAYGESLKELTFREPTGGDIARIGLPVNIDFGSEPPKVTIETVPMSAMMSVLGSVPESTIATLHPKDWTSAAWKLAGFFIPDDGA